MTQRYYNITSQLESLHLKFEFIRKTKKLGRKAFTGTMTSHKIVELLEMIERDAWREEKYFLNGIIWC